MSSNSLQCNYQQKSNSSSIVTTICFLITIVFCDYITCKIL